MTFDQFLGRIQSDLETLCDECVTHCFQDGIPEVQFRTDHEREVFFKTFRNCLWTVAMSAFAKGVQMPTPDILLQDINNEPNRICH